MYRLLLKDFANADKSTLSNITVATQILTTKGDTLAFVHLAKQIQLYLGKRHTQIRTRLPQFYTDLNVDGSLLSTPDNVWGLRAWYHYDSVHTTVNTPTHTTTVPRRKLRKLVNAFLADVAEHEHDIDYNDEHPTHTHLDAHSEHEHFEQQHSTGFTHKIGKAGDRHEHSEQHPQHGLPDGLTGQLATFGDKHSEHEHDTDTLTAHFSGEHEQHSDKQHDTHDNDKT